MYVLFFFHRCPVSCVCSRGGVWMWSGVVLLTLSGYWKIMSQRSNRWRLIMNSDAYFFFPVPRVWCPHWVPAVALHLHNLTATWQLTCPLPLLRPLPLLLTQMWAETLADWNVHTGSFNKQKRGKKNHFLRDGNLLEASPHRLDVQSMPGAMSLLYLTEPPEHL